MVGATNFQQCSSFPRYFRNLDGWKGQQINKYMIWTIGFFTESYIADSTRISWVNNEYYFFAHICPHNKHRYPIALIFWDSYKIHVLDVYKFNYIIIGCDRGLLWYLEKTIFNRFAPKPKILLNTYFRLHK